MEILTSKYTQFKHSKMKAEDNKILGTTSYSAIVSEIYEKIQKTKGATLAGDEFLQDMYKKLNESVTPLLDLKVFKTNAEQIAPDDVKLSEVLKFIDSKVKSGSSDLNFIINLCKEEHFQEMGKINHPSPKDTIKSFSDMFDKTGPVIEQGIKNGVFDSMKSSLLGEIKQDLEPNKVEPNKKLNESTSIIDGVVGKYSPVGITYNDLPNNNMILMFENECMQFDSKTKKYSKMDESVVIPDSYKRLMTAANTCAYNPETEMFGLNENWDFDMHLNAENGVVTVGGKTMDPEHISVMLKESIKLYEADNSMVRDFNKVNYLNDADNFILLAVNHNMVKQFESLTVLKNLTTDAYAIVKNDIKSPEILSTGNIKNLSSMHESFASLVLGLNNGLGIDVTKMFESNLHREQIMISENQNKILNLTESLRESEKQLEKVKELKLIPENGSKQYLKLNEQETKLDSNIALLVQDINHHKNYFKLYD